jgi:3-phosphoshikimate 1-carboxyvinyltransferase
MAGTITLKSTRQQIKGSVKIAGSKSLSNRVLIMNALSTKDSILEGLSVSDDTKRLKFYLNFIETCRKSMIPMIVNTENAGTVMRFLTAYLSVGEGKWLLSGCERMNKRPIAELVEALKSLGAKITYKGQDAYPPLKVDSKRIKGGEINIDPSRSSQFVSALMMIAPGFKYGLTINFDKKPVSKPYITMTAALMKQFGIDVRLGKHQIIIPNGKYKFDKFQVESDWSSASFWYEVIALNPGSGIEIPNLHRNSLQGDSIVSDIFKNFGVETVFVDNGLRLSNKGNAVKNFEFNAVDCPDLVPVIMATCAAKSINLKLSGIGHLKYKESDRLLAMDEELSKIGCRINRRGNSFVLSPNINVNTTSFDSHNDHRIAMCLAPLVSLFDHLLINNPAVVEKSYPDYWKDMQELNVFTIS